MALRWLCPMHVSKVRNLNVKMSLCGWRRLFCKFSCLLLCAFSVLLGSCLMRFFIFLYFQAHKISFQIQILKFKKFTNKSHIVLGERKRHHHHHHHNKQANNRNSSEFRDQNIGSANRNRHY